MYPFSYIPPRRTEEELAAEREATRRQVKDFLLAHGYSYGNGLTPQRDFFYRVPYGGIAEFTELYHSLCNHMPPQLEIQEYYSWYPGRMNQPVHSYSVGINAESIVELVNLEFSGLSAPELIAKLSICERSLAAMWQRLFEINAPLLNDQTTAENQIA